MRFRMTAIGILAAGLLLAGCSKNNSGNAEAKTPAAKTEVTATTASDKAAEEAGLLLAADSPEAPAWTLPTPDGGKLSLADYRGKVVILDFWDTWCPPCKREIPGFIDLQKKYGDKGLVIIGAAFGRDGKMAVKQFADQAGINYPVVLADNMINRNYGGISSIPTTFVIDAKCLARARHIGYTDMVVFEEQVKTLLKEI